MRVLGVVAAELRYFLSVELEGLDLTARRSSRLNECDRVGLLCSALRSDGNSSGVIAVVQVNRLTRRSLLIFHLRNRGSLQLIFHRGGVEVRNQFAFLRVEVIQRSNGSLLLSINDDFGSLRVVFCLDGYLDEVSVLLNNETLVCVLRYNLQVRQYSRSERDVYHRGVFGQLHRTAVLPNGELQGVEGVLTLDDNIILGLVFRVLSVVSHFGSEFAVEPFAVIEPFNDLHLVVHLLLEGQRRSSKEFYAIRQLIVEGISFMIRDLNAVHEEFRQIRVIDEMEIVNLQVRRIDSIRTRHILCVGGMARVNSECILSHRMCAAHNGFQRLRSITP